MSDVERLAARLRTLATAAADCNWAEFSMRVPADPERDADLVLESAAALLRSQAQQIERLRANLAALEDEKNTYIDYVGDCLGQGEDESLWDAAQRVLSERDRYRAALEAKP